jgi:hypothetical protein
VRDSFEADDACADEGGNDDTDVSAYATTDAEIGGADADADDVEMEFLRLGAPTEEEEVDTVVEAELGGDKGEVVVDVAVEGGAKGGGWRDGGAKCWSWIGGREEAEFAEGRGRGREE